MKTPLLDYIKTLTVTQGEGAGRPIQLFPWETRFVNGFESTDGDCALTIARGNGKTVLCAAIAAATVDGPLRQARAETVIVASSFAQGRIAYEHCLAFLRERGHDLENRRLWRLQDSQNSATFEDRQTGARVRCIGSDPARAHGLAPALVLCDEPAQWPDNISERMLAALRTSLGKIPNSRLIALGTRPANEAHWFQTMLDGAADYAQTHRAREDDPPFQRRTWLKANPSLAGMPELEKRIRKEAADAKRDESMLASFRALRLNLGLADIAQATLLDATVWEAAEGEADMDGSFVLGIDLGGSASMSAAAAYWPKTGAFDAIGCFPTIPDLAERGLRDGVGKRYMDMLARGELILAGGRIADVPMLLTEALNRWGTPSAVVADRWRIPELADALDAVRFPRSRLIERGQGYKDGGEDVRDFRTAVLRGRVTPVKSLLMRSAMGEARVAMDPAGNCKLTKTGNGRRTYARDDAAAAGILAVAAGERKARIPKRAGAYLGLA